MTAELSAAYQFGGAVIHMLPMVSAGTKGMWCQFAWVTHLRDMLPEGDEPGGGCSGHSLLRPAAGSVLVEEAPFDPLPWSAAGGSLEATAPENPDVASQPCASRPCPLLHVFLQQICCCSLLVPLRSSMSTSDLGKGGRAGQGRAGQGRAGQGRAGQGRAGQETSLWTWILWPCQRAGSSLNN